MDNRDEQSRQERARARISERRKKQALAAKQTESPSQGNIFVDLLESYGLTFIAVLVIAVLLILVLLTTTILRSCSGQTQEPASSRIAPSSATTSESPSSSDVTVPASSTPVESNSALSKLMSDAIQKGQEALKTMRESEGDIRDVLEDDLADKLLEQAETNADAAWIAKHPNAYDLDGWTVQHKTLKLAAEEPSAIDYVRHWPDIYPQYEQDLSPENALPATYSGPQKIPQLFQYDKRWGYTIYCSTSFGLTGCCPTALAMVYQGLTGNTDKTPYDLGVLAEEKGYMATFDGTDAYFLMNEAPDLGLSCEEISPTRESIIAALDAQKILIVNLGEGEFTIYGHYIVLTGMEDGQLIINDPYSKVRSDKLWDVSNIASQSKTIFAYSKA